MLEPKCAAIPRAVHRVERPHHAPHDVGYYRKGSLRRRNLNVNAAARTERTRSFDQRTAAADLDERHRTSRPQGHSDIELRGHWEPRLRPTLDELPVHVHLLVLTINKLNPGRPVID
jgi:hypothetical protein